MTECVVCPRSCAVDRAVRTGYCNAGVDARVAKTMLHMWEEPPISGTRGSGAVFFSNCSLRCAYCQNHDISQQGLGRDVTAQQLADLFRALEEQGAHNLNLVTPTHYTDQILEALQLYRPKVPVVWNTSSYETVDNIKRISDVADVYLADLKYCSGQLSQKYSHAADYFSRATEAILQMRKNRPQDLFDNEGIMTEGLIIRHLVLPSSYHDSNAVLDWIADKLGIDTFVSLMNQYTPCFDVLGDPLLGRRTKPLEYKLVVAHLEKLGFHNGFLQEATSQTLDYTPNFNVY